MTKKLLKVLPFIMIACILFMPDCAFAADNVFTIISRKMVDTVKDVRRVVYVIAGFGLIMFAFLAIFNKISWKHLSYICIGLFLLSVMMPFINYFSGAQLTDELSYGDYTSRMGDTAAQIAGSDIEDQQNVPGAQRPDMGDLLPKIENGLGSLGAGASTEMNGGLAGQGSGSGASGGAGGYDANGCRTNANGQRECCEHGVNASGTGCKKTFGETLGDIFHTADNVVGGIQEGMSALESGKSAVEGMIKGAQQAGDIIGNSRGGLGGLLETAGQLGGLLRGASDGVGSDINNAFGHYGNAKDRMGEAGIGNGNAPGSTSSDIIEGVQDGVNRDRGVLQDTGRAMERVDELGDRVKGVGQRFEDFFKKF